MLVKNVNREEVESFVEEKYFQQMLFYKNQQPYGAEASQGYTRTRSEFMSFCQGLLFCGEQKLVNKLLHLEKQL